MVQDFTKEIESLQAAEKPSYGLQDASRDPPRAESKPTHDDSQDARYAPPDVAVADVGMFPVGLQPATRVDRLVAAFIDGLIQGGLVWLIIWLSSWNLFAEDADQGILRSVIMGLAGVILFWLLQGYLLFKHGQTIGKHLLKIRIARPSGEPASAGRIILRYGVGFLVGLIPIINGIYALIDALLIFRASRRCLHDDIADTMVFKIEAAR